MIDDEPKDRLKVARLGAGLTRQQLAAKLGKAQSTIRAHENGQNKIQPEAAAEYAKELGVSPAWLLYGIEDVPPPPPGPVTRLVPIVGEIWDRPRFEKVGDDPTFEEKLTVSLPEYADEKLSAWVVHDEDWDPEIRHYYITMPEDRLSLRDSVVLRISEQSFYYYDIWRVGAEKGWTLFYKGDTQSKAHEIMKVRDLNETVNGVQHLTIMGVVIAEVRVRRRIVWRDRPEIPDATNDTN